MDRVVVTAATGGTVAAVMAVAAATAAMAVRAVTAGTVVATEGAMAEALVEATAVGLLAVVAP